MSNYATVSVKLSRNKILELRAFPRFDGKDGNPEKVIYRDTHPEACGLRLRLSPGGAMTYVVHGRVGSRPSQYFTIGDARELSLKRGREIAADFVEQMHKGERPVVKKSVIWNFKNVYQQYTMYKQHKIKEDTLKAYQYLYGKLHPWFLSSDINRIDEEQIEKEHKRITEAGSPEIADRVFTHIVLPVFNYATKARNEHKKPIIEHNPTAVMRYKRLWNVNGGRSKRKKEVIRSEDLAMLMDAIDEIGDMKDTSRVYGGYDYITPFVVSRFFKFLLFTGFRPAEAASIEWSQVSKDFSTITWDDVAAKEKLKNAEEQPFFPLNTEAQHCLRELAEIQQSRSKWVFPSRTPTVHIKANPTDYIKKLEEITGKRFTCGIYRKTFQTYANSLGIDSNSIKKLVFHTQVHYDVQSGYMNENEGTMRGYSQRVADYILEHAGRIESEELSGKLAAKAAEKGLTEKDIMNMLDALPSRN